MAAMTKEVPLETFPAERIELFDHYQVVRSLG